MKLYLKLFARNAITSSAVILIGILAGYFLVTATNLLVVQTPLWVIIGICLVFALGIVTLAERIMSS
ncbi:hypothetical protein SmphiM12_492 [Sinorhizobium phage phiM12]|uniref:Transmembrane protein n=1 Tax=Sinorhizobium phage phiM12 TaxID=1357423 RepID=S5MDN3_9CAUD|nr:hypothetical protein AB690_gp136 [Sinorhizobium phage phiM12]AGR48124.1 hypothetical protein SmphiM12_492 [Sinorhizobium phage phiM12]